MWKVEFTDVFETWWGGLPHARQDAIDLAVGLLAAQGPHLRFPWCSGIQGSRHSRMRELRIQHRGEPVRILYAFDSRRVAVLLIGGTKRGDDRWYVRMIPKADELLDRHIEQLEQGS